MSGGGKKKGKNIKNTTVAAPKKSLKKDKAIILTVCIVSAVIIILLTLFSGFIHGCVLDSLLVVGYELIGAALVIIAILLDVKKSFIEKYKVHISACVCFIFILTSAYAIRSINSSNGKGEGNKTVKVVEVKEEPTEVSFVINFNDALFSNYTAEDLEKNKDALTAQIIKAVKKGDAVTLKISDTNYDLYEDCVLMSQDYENVYDKCIESHIFEKYNKNELVSFLDSAIDCRKDGDKAFSTYENRRCIALRYNDKGYELCRNENINEALAAYESAIEYGVGALCVQFKSRNKGNSDTEKIIDAILRGYTGITELTTEDNGNYKKSIVLIEIFEKVKREL